MRHSASLRIESLARGRICYLRLHGTVDETFDHKELIEAIEGRDAILNLKAVKRFTSFGVREWVHFIEALKKRVDRLLFVDCSLAFVGQLNVVSNFAGNAQVVSVQVPYFCADCEWDTDQICELTDNQQPELSDDVVCRRCGAKMAFDDDKDSYFAFLNGVKVAKPDSELLNFLKTFSEAQPDVGGGSAKPASTRPSLAARLHSLEGAAASRGRSAYYTVRRLARIGGRRGNEIWHSLSTVQRIAAAAAAVGFGMLLVVVILPAAPSPPDRVEEVKALIEGGKIAEAESLMDLLDIEEEMSEQLTVRIAVAREAARQEREKQITEGARNILESFGAKAYNRVIEEWSAAKTLHEHEPEVCFAVAESFRLTKQHEDAVILYEYLTKNWDKNKRYDDSLFWLAEQYREAGETELARANYKTITRMRDSNFRRSAWRRLKSLARSKKRK